MESSEILVSAALENKRTKGKTYFVFFVFVLSFVFVTLRSSNILTKHGVILWFIIRNRYVVFNSISGTELLKFLEFPKCYVNKMTFGEPLGCFRWGLDSNGANQVIRGFQHSVSPIDFWGWERGWRLISIYNNQWFSQIMLM